MKAIRSELYSKEYAELVGNMESEVSQRTGFPITITVTIESQAEVDALLLAHAHFDTPDIDNQYNLEDRRIWVEVLEKLAEAME